MSKILIVDDSSTMRYLVGEALEEANHSVVEAGDGLEALEILKVQKDIEMVISDVLMPNLMGLALVEKIRQMPEYKTLPIIMLTTEATLEDRALGKSLGVVAWVVKPFKKLTVIPAIERILANHKAAQKS